MANAPQPAAPGKLAKAVSRLRPIEREVLFLSAREGLRNREIAARLGISTAAVERHLADALYRLDRHIERLERPWWKLW